MDQNSANGGHVLTDILPLSDESRQSFEQSLREGSSESKYNSECIRFDETFPTALSPEQTACNQVTQSLRNSKNQVHNNLTQILFEIEIA